MRKFLAAAVLALWPTLAPAQSPSPVPSLPDAPRLTQYTIATSTCNCPVNFAIYGDGQDVDNWLQVFIGTTAVLSTDPVFGWTLTSASGPLANIARPITNAVLVFNQNQSGAISILGARRPRRISQFQENRGVPARDLNQAVTDQIAMLREDWDRGKRSILGQPGEVLNLLPPAATRANQALAFDVNGNPTLISPTFQAPLQANTTIFVDGLNGNDNNSGLAAGAGNAWATFAPAYKYLCYQHFGNGFAATIQVANVSSITGAGGIGGAFQLTCTPLGYTFIVLNLGGGTLTPASGFDAILLYNSMQGNGFVTPALHIVNGTITCSGGGAGLHVVAGDAVIENTGGAVTFGTCTGGSHIFADGNHARIFLNSGYTISGNASFHWTAFAAGGIDFNTAATITCTGSPAFTTFAAASLGGGWIYAPFSLITFSGCGTVTGQRYAAADNGTIITALNGNAANFFPGNSAGSVSVGGRYDAPGTPTVTGCGTTPGTPTGTDQSGSVQEGTTATGCTINFTTANAPKACTAALNGASATPVAVGVTGTTLVVIHANLSNATLYWNCPAN